MGFKKIMIAAFSAGVIMSLASVTAMADSTGWREEDSTWRYYTSETEYVTNQWKSIDGNWYYFMDDGSALIDKWAYIDHKLYHFDSSGHMEKNKWICCGTHQSEEDSWSTNRDLIYTEAYSGAKDYRYVGPDGAAYIGWKKIDGSWYYFSDDKERWYMGSQFGYYGLMKIGWFVDKDYSQYCFAPNGKLMTNTWYNAEGDSWFYFGSDGRAYEGWNKVGGQWYWFDPYRDEGDYSYVMGIGLKWTFAKDGKWGYVWFDKNGKPLSGWQEIYGEWFYTDSEGYLYVSRWLKYKNNYYYFDSDGCMVKDAKDYFVDGRLYNFNSNGICTNNSGTKVNGWHEIKGKDKPDYISSPLYVYVGSDGATYKNKWLNYKGAWYYFDSEGYMVANDYAIENGKLYEFDKNGKCKDPNPMHKGWYELVINADDEEYKHSRWLYFGSDGRFLTGWQKLNNKWYYLDKYIGFMDSDGIIKYDDISDDWWHLKPDGELVIGWYKNDDSQWYYSDSSGRAFHDGWLSYGGKWYYFNGFEAVTNVKYLLIDDKYYDFDENGACLNPEGRPMGVLIIDREVHG